jgi:prepilin-type N-terminal cleavage/methylation domain-containing protein/prepilin-type processing-associated H-X9-DG protein
VRIPEHNAILGVSYASAGFPCKNINYIQKRGSVVRKKGFTLIELLVVISIIALLLSVLLPGLTAAKKRVRAVVCRSNLKQWGYIYSLYAFDNDDSFPQGDEGNGVNAEDAWLLGALLPYYNTLKMRMCPSTITITRPPMMDQPGGTFTNWGPFPVSDDGATWFDSLAVGSYAFNEWCADVPAKGDWWGLKKDNAIRKLTAAGSYNIPLVGDSAFVDTAVNHGDAAPSNTEHEEDDFSPGVCNWNSDAMKYYCIDRHKGGINMVFVDLNSRYVGLRELWNLRWHKNFKMGLGPSASNAWPSWLRKYKAN